MINPGEKVEMTIPNQPINFNDAEFARCLATRHSYYCTLIMVLGVMVQMKVNKTESPMIHTTDSEMKTNFNGCRNLMPVRGLFDCMGCPCQDPSPMFMDNRSVHAVIESGRITPRVRHFDIPIAFLHAHRDTIFKPILIKTDRMLADIGTKPLTPAVHKRIKYWITGYRYMKLLKDEHRNYLEMQFYEIAYHELLKIVKKLNSSQNGSNENV